MEETKPERFPEVIQLQRKGNISWSNLENSINRKNLILSKGQIRQSSFCLLAGLVWTLYQSDGFVLKFS